MSLLRDAQKLALEPAAVEPIVPKWTRSVRCRVRRLAFLGRQTVDALTRRGISLLHNAGVFVRGRRMQPATERAPDAFGPAYSGVMAPPSATSALGRTGPGGSAPDLTVAAADDDLLTNEVSGITARNRVRDVDPRDTSVSMGGSAHKARSVLDELVERGADRRRAEGRHKGGPLCSEPNSGFGGDVWDVDDLEEGRRRYGFGLDRNHAWDGNEAANVFERTCHFGRGRDTGGGNEDAGLDVHGIF
jgi:hypothetical protein